MTEERATIIPKINLTSEEAAAVLNVSRPTLLRWTHMEGGLPHFSAGRKLLYPHQGLVEWSAQQAGKRAAL